MNHVTIDYSLEFDPVSSAEENLAWGRLTLSLDGEEVWFQQDSALGEKLPAHWTWSDLLAHMGENWSALMQEESYPLGLNPATPLELRRLANESWEGMDEAQVDDEDEELYRFEFRHNLSAGLNGIYLPDLIVMREGQLAWVCIDGTCLRLPISEVVQTLESLGNEIAAQLQGSSNPRAELALFKWSNRNNISVDEIVELKTGIPAEDIPQFAEGMSAEAFWGLDVENNIFDSEILAAARYASGVLDFESQKCLLSTVRTFKYVETPELDSLSAECGEFISTLSRKEPFEQGYAAAGWLRDRLAVTTVFDPESLLKNWGVEIKDIEVDRALDALAFWGKKHGPAILVNMAEGAVCRKLTGRRATLAHEICHLLIDRSGSLPFADAVGGTTPAWVEKRARAFAAELLLPRDIAYRAAVQYGLETITPQDLDKIIQQLTSDYQVSTGLAVHQLKNSRLLNSLPREVGRYLRRRNSEVAGRENGG